jgi:hypothetical protein
MSDIVERLRLLVPSDSSGAAFDGVNEITRLTAENEKLRAALRVWCEAELNAYYRMKYPGGHPHSQKELAQAMASNPATVALKENNNDQG